VTPQAPRATQIPPSQLPPQQGPEVALQAWPFATHTALGVTAAPQKPPPSAAGRQTSGAAQLAAVRQPPLAGLVGQGGGGVSQTKLLGSHSNPGQQTSEPQNVPAWAQALLEQTPTEQVSPAGQTRPQPPQLLGSLSRLVQPPAQQLSPAWHAQPPRQLPPVQLWPTGQVTPQAPQLLGSVEVLVQTPPHCVSGLGQPLELPLLLDPVLPVELPLPEPRAQAHCQLLPTQVLAGT
jgi:hypothetical protein